MRFVIIYRNRDDVRATIERIIPDLIRQKAPLTTQEVHHSIFRSFPFWPAQSSINSLPFNMQCEEVEYMAGKLVSIRKLVIDVEVIEAAPPAASPETAPQTEPAV